eukprot:3738183-Rhodomonas_salina.1
MLCLHAHPAQRVLLVSASHLACRVRVCLGPRCATQTAYDQELERGEPLTGRWCVARCSEITLPPPVYEVSESIKVQYHGCDAPTHDSVPALASFSK